MQKNRFTLLNSILKNIELKSRRCGEWLFSYLLSSSQKRRESAKQALHTPPARILIVRLDARIGNAILLTPLLKSIKKIWPNTHLSVAMHPTALKVLTHISAIDSLIPVHKKIWHQHGILKQLFRLRRLRFDWAFNAGNLMGPTFTHPVFTRLTGARFCLGPHKHPISQIYDYVVTLKTQQHTHEIAQRLALIEPFIPATSTHKEFYSELPAYAHQEQLHHLSKQHHAFIENACPHDPRLTYIIIIGARLAHYKQLSIDHWAMIAEKLLHHQAHVSVIFGPQEYAAAVALHNKVKAVHVAPPSSIEQAAVLFYQSRGVLGADCGLSHLAAAVKAPLLVFFTQTDPLRYGHMNQTYHHTYADLRLARSDALKTTSLIEQAVDTWHTTLENDLKKRLG